jgi:hypothetical protein
MLVLGSQVRSVRSVQGRGKLHKSGWPPALKVCVAAVVLLSSRPGLEHVGLEQRPPE